MTMTDDETKTILRVAETLEKAARQLRQLIATPRQPLTRPVPADISDDLIKRFRDSDRAAVKAELVLFSHRRLGEVFGKLGGLSRERKRSKDWLIERILWHLFDFQAGHEIVRR